LSSRAKSLLSRMQSKESEDMSGARCGVLQCADTDDAGKEHHARSFSTQHVLFSLGCGMIPQRKSGVSDLQFVTKEPWLCWMGSGHKVKWPVETHQFHIIVHRRAWKKNEKDTNSHQVGWHRFVESCRQRLSILQTSSPCSPSRTCFHLFASVVTFCNSDEE
jgi:hypothetical protein